MGVIDAILRKLRFCGRIIYNRKKGLIFGKSPIDLLKLSLFILFLYIVIAVIFVAQYFIIKSAYVGSDAHILKLPSSDIISLKPGVFLAAGSIDYFSQYKCAQNQHTKLIKDVEVLLTEHRAAHSRLACPLTFSVGFENNKCGMDVSQLGGKCSTSPFGYGTRQFCLYLRLAKIAKFNPPGENSNDYINIECKQKNIVIQTNPSGFIRNMLPYKGGDDLQPLIAIIVNAENDSSVKCVLKAKGVTVSESFSPSVATGVIEVPIKLGPSHGC